MLTVVGCKVSPQLRAGRGRSVGRTGQEVERRDTDEEYYENMFNFEELFLGHLKIISTQQEDEQINAFPGRLSPLIKLKLKPRT